VSYDAFDVFACNECNAIGFWSPDVRVDGSPFLKCRQCGHAVTMPLFIERELRAKGWIPKLAISRQVA